jgi:hypothetical protein
MASFVTYQASYLAIPKAGFVNLKPFSYSWPIALGV